jgi:hypothetical protein
VSWQELGRWCNHTLGFFSILSSRGGILADFASASFFERCSNTLNQFVNAQLANSAIAAKGPLIGLPRCIHHRRKGNNSFTMTFWEVRRTTPIGIAPIAPLRKATSQHVGGEYDAKHIK